MNFDIIFLDPATPQPYCANTLDHAPLGGSEASLVRVAEGLAAAGLRVGVFVGPLNQPVNTTAVAYLPFSLIDQVTSAQHVVAFRSTAGLEAFPAAKKYMWLEDVPDASIAEHLPLLLHTRTTIIAVSDWHRTVLTHLLTVPGHPLPPILTRFNPAPDEIYRAASGSIDRNKLVWLASPHKGLDAALPLFAALRVQIPTLRLHVFHPGYQPAQPVAMAGVVFESPLPCRALWSHVREALAVFYPSHFQETFGCIAAEANALNTPVAAYAHAGLTETISSAEQTVALGEVQLLCANIVAWHGGARPTVRGQDRFRVSQVVPQWLDLLRGAC